MTRSFQEGLAIARGDFSTDTPGRREFRLEEDPAGKPNYAQNI
jgi:hypothetical protein